MPRLDVHMSRALVYVFYRVYVVQVKFRVDALSIKIERKGYEIDISSPLAVSEERALDPFGSREHTELRRGDCRSAVVVRVQADYCVFAVGETAAEILYLIGKKIRRAALDGRGEIQYHFVVLIRAECVHDRCTDVCGKVRLRAHEALGRVFIYNVCAVGFCLVAELLYELCCVDGNISNAPLVCVKHDFSLQSGGGVIEMEDDIFGALYRLKSLSYKMLARLHKHLYLHVVRDISAVYQRAEYLVFCLARRREPDFYFLYANGAERLEHLKLLRQVHRIDERLIAVPQVDTAPCRRALDFIARPCARFKLDGLERYVFFAALFHFENLQK